MSSLSNNAELRQSLRAKGLARARGFSWEAVAQQTLAIYRAVSRG
jgi:glycosyltransferase involved in cell wall biosynthesis